MLSALKTPPFFLKTESLLKTILHGDLPGNLGDQWVLLGHTDIDNNSKDHTDISFRPFEYKDRPEEFTEDQRDDITEDDSSMQAVLLLDKFYTSYNSVLHGTFTSQLYMMNKYNDTAVRILVNVLQPRKSWLYFFINLLFLSYLSYLNTIGRAS